MQIELSQDVSKALESVCRKNFRTPELQILYWLTKEGEQVSPAILPSTKKVIARQSRNPGGRSRESWTPEARAQAAERMKKQWATGTLNRHKSAKSALDVVAAGGFDD